MKMLDRHIEWVVVLSIVFVTTFFISNNILTLYYPRIKIVADIIRLILIALLFLYQIQHQGIKVHNRAFLLFFLLYSVYIFIYIEIIPRYSLKILYSVPSSTSDFLFKTLIILMYLFSAHTIMQKFNVLKYVIVSVLVCLIPTLLYIKTVGIDIIQTYGQAGSEANEISRLVFAYTNAPLLLLAVVFYNKFFRRKWLSRILSICVIIGCSIILIISTKRGPILWSVVGILICFFYTNRNVLKYFFLVFTLGIILYANIDIIINGIRKIAPMSAERITETIYYGETAHRLDISDKENSGYLLGLRQFAKSPIIGSYFRLITESEIFKGHYPHNIFIEILITMGLLGFIPFMLLLFQAFRKAHKTFKDRYTANQLACFVLFLAALLRRMTTGSILLDTMFWLFFYIMCSIDSLCKQEIKISLKNKHCIKELQRV